jgi:ribosomal protein L7Ae-like RNA K-turn-binding protein
MTNLVEVETPADLVPQILEMLSVAKDSGKVKKGVNETTKSVERKSAKFVVVATDVSPAEIIVHIPMLCKENGIPCASVPSMKELGVAIGITKGTTSVSVENAGASNEKLADLLKRLPKAGAKAEEKKVEKPKEAPKKEEPKKEPKKEAPKKEEKPKEEPKKEAPKKEEKPKEEPKKEEKPKEEKPTEKPKEEPKKEEKKEEKPKEEKKEAPKEEKKE